MVISCPECSTKFRVSAEKIPAKGAKLRCARCRHIFFVMPEEEPSPAVVETPAPAVRQKEDVPAPEAPSAAAEQPPEQSDFADHESYDSEDTFGETDFGFNTDTETQSDTAENSDAGFAGSFDETAAPSDNIDFGFEEDPPTTPQEEAFSADSVGEENTAEIGAGVNDEFDASAFEDESAVNDDAFSFEEDYGNVSIGGEDDGDAFSFGEDSDTGSAFDGSQPEPQDEISTEDAAAGFSEETPYPPSVEEEQPPTDFYASPEEDVYGEQDLPARAPSRKKRGPFATLILFLLVLILGIVVAGGILYWQSGPEALLQTYQRLTGQEISTPDKGQILVKNLQGSFVSNKVAGELLVIHGNAVNDFRDSRAAIQVKGILFDAQGNQLRQKTIFCGNPISTEDLRTLPYDRLEEIMGNQFGESLANLNVTPGQVIPFTIVFRDIPGNLSEFTVEVADSNPAAQ